MSDLMHDSDNDVLQKASPPARETLEVESPGALSSPTENRPKRFRGWQQVVTTVLCMVAVGLVADVVRRNWETVTMIAEGRVAWKWLVAAVACLIGTQILALCRWVMLARALGVCWSTRTYFDVAMASEATSIVAPGANGGDIAKLAYTLRTPDERVKIAASIVCDRLSGLFGLLVVGCIAGAFSWPGGSVEMQRITLVTGGTLLASIAGAVIALGPLRAWLFSVFPRRWASLARIADDLNYACATYQSQPLVLAQAVAMSTISQTLSLTALFLIGVGFQPDDHARWDTVLVAGPWVFLSTALPLPFGALGVTEQVSEELFRVLGGRGGGVVALTYRAVVFTSTLILVGLWLIVRRVKR